MTMTVKRRKDTQYPKVFVHRLADVRGGVSIKTSELSGSYLPEGSVLSAPDANGLTHVVKYGIVQAAVTATGKKIKIDKNRGFKVGDYIMAAVGNVAYEITAIDTTNSTYDEITVGTTLGAIAKDAFIMQAAAESSTTDSALKYTPLALSGTGKAFDTDSNLDMDAWIIGVTHGNPLPEAIATALKGIINY